MDSEKMCQPERRLLLMLVYTNLCKKAMAGSLLFRSFRPFPGPGIYGLANRRRHARIAVQPALPAVHQSRFSCRRMMYSVRM